MQNVIEFKQPNSKPLSLKYIDMQINELLPELKPKLPDSERIRIQTLILNLSRLKKTFIEGKTNN